MKTKIIISIILGIFLNIHNLYAEYNPTSSDKIIINKLSSKINNLLYNNTLNFRENLKNKINSLQKKYKNNKKMYFILQEVKRKNYLISNKNEYLNHYKKYNINFEKIKFDWLNWHNYERTKLGRSKYSYDDRLNQTAFEWSKQQNKLGKMTHERKKGDGYYNYKKIEQWFNDRGIKCKISGGATSSESIAKYGYYCNDNDCTDELSKSLKEIFNIYMTEKGLPGIKSAHYKGIVLPSLNKIGIGLFINENYSGKYGDYKSYDYYVTTHYCTNFKK